ncbi:MAG: 2-dehydropantoate 2-reductase [Gemmatimonadota bacterium]|nr:2-dehydropantoate 2-reductase [Gemmatimonadota bacterium]
MRIAILGAGGVGGYFGALLARAGNDVLLYARGQHLDAIRANGITVREGDVTFAASVRATNVLTELAGAEFVLFAVKSYSLAEVAPVAQTLALGGATIVPLLNGVEAADDLMRHGVPEDRVLGGLTSVSAFKAAPGVIHHTQWKDRIVVGELDGRASPRVAQLVDVLGAAGVDAFASTNIVVDLWRKFNMLCAMAAACGMSRTGVGGIRDTPLGKLLIQRAVAEIAAVGRARGIDIPAQQEAETMAGIEALPKAMKPSFLLDLERGGPNELDVLSGAVSRFGRETGVATPVHDTAAAVLAAGR